LHWGAVVEKVAARIDAVAGRKKKLGLEPFRRDEPSREAQPDEARSALGAAAIDIVVTKKR
jgi:hypothetical protein